MGQIRRLENRWSGLRLWRGPAVACLAAGIAVAGAPAVAAPAKARHASASAPACDTARLTVTFKLIPGSQGAGNVEYRLTVGNATAHDCWLGAPTITLLGAGGSPLPSHSLVKPWRTYLPAGGGASAPVRFSPDVPGTGDSQTGPCEPSAQSIAVTFRGAPGSATAPFAPPSAVCERGQLSISPLTQFGPAGASHAKLWTNANGTAVCGIERPAPGQAAVELLCSSRGIPRARRGVGDPYVRLAARGRPEPVLISQFSYETTHATRLRAGAVWSALGLTCRIAAGVTCINASGDGFRLGPGRYAAF